MKLIIIRRPETNKDAGLPGEPNGPSPLGRQQLDRVAEVCRTTSVQVVVYSPMPRAAIAAKVLAGALNVPTVPDDGVHERTFGDWDDWDWPKIAAQLGKLPHEERYSFAPPNGESWQQMESRLHAALNRIAALGYDSAAVMTHIGAMRALLPLVRNEPRESTLALMPDYGEFFVEQYTAAG